MKPDLIIRGGMVIDPSTHTYGVYDVAVSGGRIAALLEPGASTERGIRELNVAGSYVVPGLIDIHTHIFRTIRGMGLKPDTIGVEQGVTTVVDAGSSGERDFELFIKESKEVSRSEVLAWINISSPGLTEGRSELADLNLLNIEKTLARIAQHPDTIIGIKARMSGSVVKQSGISPLVIAKAAAREANLPVMVHVGNAPPKLGEVLELLDAGDVVTHAFHGKHGGILDAEGKLIQEAVDALKRGVLFDVGHGSSSFSFETMAKAKLLSIHPYSISTDIYTENLIHGPVYSLTLTMTKFLALGYSLEKVIEWSTWAPAKALGRSGEIGTLQAGTIADITIFNLTEQPTELLDSEQHVRSYHQRIEPKYTIKTGEIYSCTT